MEGWVGEEKGRDVKEKRRRMEGGWVTVTEIWEDMKAKGSGF